MLEIILQQQMKDRRSRILLSKWNAILASLLLPPTYASINMFADAQNVGTISIDVSAEGTYFDVEVSTENMGTTLFDDAIHEYPTNNDKPQLFLQNLVPEEFVDIQLTLTASQWPTYPARAMMVLYNTVTTNDASFLGQTTGNAAYTSFTVHPDVSDPFSRSNFVWDRNTNLPVQVPIFELFITIYLEVQDYYLYLDKVYAIREFSLTRPMILLLSIFYLLDGSVVQNVQADDPIVSLSFTDFPVPNPGTFGCVVHSFQTNQLAIYLSTDGVPYALISSVFFQFGPANTNDFQFVIYPSIWNSGIWSQTPDSQLIIDSTVPVRKTGNFIYDFTSTTEPSLLQFNGEPIPLARADFLFLQSTGSQICSVQWFGWYFCQVVAFTPASDTIKMAVGQTKSIMIGTLTAYYDPDTQKQNNPFCAMGFWYPIDLLDINDALVYNQLSPTIDSETLAVTLIDFQAPVGVAGDSIQLKVKFYPDTRTDALISPPPTSFKELMPTIKLWNFCDVSILAEGIVTLSDGSDIPKTYEYKVGSGVQEIVLKATADCEGFISGEVTFSETESGRIIATEFDFKNCQTFEPNPLFCVYFDKESSVLKVFSDSKHLKPEMQITYSFTARLKGTDSSGVLQSGKSTSYDITVTFLSDNVPPELEGEKIRVGSNNIVYYTYFIGIINTPLALKSYYSIDSNLQLAKIEVTQTSGSLPQENFYVNSTTFDFYIDSMDASFEGQKSVFNFCAYLTTLHFNCDLVLYVYYKVATDALKIAKNTPPYFSAPLGTPDPIPCLAFDEARQWIYNFPLALDRERNTIIFDVDCGQQTIFIAKMIQDVLTLKLDTAEDDLQKMSILCKVTLFDQLEAKSASQIVFQSACSQQNDNNTKTAHPKPTIRNINSDGEIEIEWNVEMVVKDFNLTSRSLSANSAYDDCLAVAITAGRGDIYSESRNLSFTYNVSKFDRRMTTVKLNFTTPADVSTQPMHDLVAISFNHSRCFTGMNRIQVNQSIVLTHKLPRQNSTGVFETSSLVRNLLPAMTTALAFVLVMNFFLKGLLNSLLSSIVSLGVIFHMFLVTLNYPAEMMNFFGLIFPLITFDALPIDSFYERIFKFSQITSDGVITDQFDHAGYSSFFVVKNIGSLFFISIIQIAVCIFLWFSRRFQLFGQGNCVQDLLNKLANDTLWNGIIQFYADNYLIFTVVSFVESNSLRFGGRYSSTENFCSLLSILGMALSVLFPLFIFCLYWKKLEWLDPKKDRLDKILFLLNQKKDTPIEANKSYDLLNNEYLAIILHETDKHKNFIETQGCLIQGLKVRKNLPLVTIMTPVADLVLKLLIAVSITRLINWPVFSIFVFNFAILAYTEFILYFTPFNDRVQQVLASFNAVCFLLLNYHLFLFTKYTDASMLPQVANSVIYLFWFCIGVNFSLTAPVQLLRTLIQLRYQFLMRKQRNLHLKAGKRRAEQIQNSEDFKLRRVNDQDSNKKQNPAVDIVKDWSAKEEKRVDKLRDYSEDSEYSSDSNNKSYDQERKVQWSGHLKINRFDARAAPNKPPETQLHNSGPQLIQMKPLKGILKKRTAPAAATPKQVTPKPDLKQENIQQRVPYQFTGAEMQELISFGKLKIQSEKVNTRNMTAKETLEMMKQIFQPIAWTTKQPTLESDQDYMFFRPLQGLEPNDRFQYNTICTMPVLQTEQLVEVREYWEDKQQRCFSVLLNGRYKLCVKVPKDKKYGSGRPFKLVEEIEKAVRVCQLELESREEFDDIDYGHVDRKLKVYYDYYQGDPCLWVQPPGFDLNRFNCDWPMYSISMTLQEKMKLYRGIRNGIR